MWCEVDKELLLSALSHHLYNSSLLSPSSYYHKMHVTQPCDAACKAGFLCGLKSARSHDHTFCATPPGVMYKEMQVYMKQMDQC